MEASPAAGSNSSEELKSEKSESDLDSGLLSDPSRRRGSFAMPVGPAGSALNENFL